MSIERLGWTPSPKRGSIDGTPKVLPRLTPGAPEVTRSQKLAKKMKMGFFGISASRGFRKVIVCHTFGEKKIDHF